jgi:hypothetical protein
MKRPPRKIQKPILQPTDPEVQVVQVPLLLNREPFCVQGVTAQSAINPVDVEALIRHNNQSADEYAKEAQQLADQIAGLQRELDQDSERIEKWAAANGTERAQDKEETSREMPNHSGALKKCSAVKGRKWSKVEGPRPKHGRESINYPTLLTVLPRNMGFLTGAEVMDKQQSIASLKVREQGSRRLEHDYRRKAEQWQSFAVSSGETKGKLFSRLDQDDYSDYLMLCQLAGTDSEACSLLARKALRFINPLMHLANKGNKTAAEELAGIASVTTRTIHEAGTRNPALLIEVAAQSLDWPVMLSCKKNFHLDPFQFLESIHQGFDAALPLLPESTWAKNDHTGCIAWKLWQYVFYWHQLVTVCERDKFWHWEFDSFQTKAARLKLFDQNWKDWWELGKQALKEAYGDPVQEPELRKVGEPKRDRSKFEGKIPDRDIRRAIYRDLRARFESFAGANRT